LLEPGGLSKSPDGRHEAELSYAGEIPFGPAYFTLRINSRTFANRTFGHGALWSPDSSILVVTEWHTIDRERGPITSLLLIRLDDWTCSRFPILDKGFALANYFVGHSMVLRHTDEIFQGGSFKVERETDLSTIDDWNPLTANG
jgi:hypothetical protein